MGGTLPLKYYNSLAESLADIAKQSNSHQEPEIKDPVSQTIVNRGYGWKLHIKFQVPEDYKVDKMDLLQESSSSITVFLKLPSLKWTFQTFLSTALRGDDPSLTAVQFLEDFN